jgi:hypothetical protein
MKSADRIWRFLMAKANEEKHLLVKEWLKIAICSICVWTFIFHPDSAFRCTSQLNCDVKLSFASLKTRMGFCNLLHLAYSLHLCSAYTFVVCRQHAIAKVKCGTTFKCFGPINFWCPSKSPISIRRTLHFNSYLSASGDCFVFWSSKVT